MHTHLHIAKANNGWNAKEWKRWTPHVSIDTVFCAHMSCMRKRQGVRMGEDSGRSKTQTTWRFLVRLAGDRWLTREWRTAVPRLCYLCLCYSSRGVVPVFACHSPGRHWWAVRSTWLRIHLPFWPPRGFLVGRANLRGERRRSVILHNKYPIHMKQDTMSFLEFYLPLSKISFSCLVLRFLSQNSLSKSPSPEVYCSQAMSGSWTTRWGQGKPRFTWESPESGVTI